MIFAGLLVVLYVTMLAINIRLGYAWKRSHARRTLS